MLAIRNKTSLQHLSYLSAFFLSILLSACAQSTAQLQTPARSTKNKAALVEELESAKQEDWSSALDPHVAPSEAEDFLDQMNKADRAIKELTHGFEVPQSEIDDALLVPPKSLSSQKRLQLIRQLQDAALAFINVARDIEEFYSAVDGHDARLKEFSVVLPHGS